MGQQIELTAADGHALAGWLAEAPGARHGIVVVQEIFGVNSHIRAVTDRFAAEGFTAIAPALFDRVEPGFESGYSEADVDRARGFLKDFDWDKALADVEAAVTRLKEMGMQKVSVVGFCLGGSLAFMAATRLEGLASAVGYYGGRIAAVAEETPRCPVMLHFGRQDHSISMENVETIRAARPEVEIHLYDAGHGFNCDARASYDAEAAKLAWGRTLEHLRKAG